MTPEADRPCVEIERLSVTFERWGQRVPALRGIDLQVPRGEWVMLVGPNGSGKSTLLRAIAGRVLPDPPAAPGETLEAPSPSPGDELSDEDRPGVPESEERSPGWDPQGNGGSEDEQGLRSPARATRVEVLGRSILRMGLSERASHVFLVHQEPLVGTARTLTVEENLTVASEQPGAEAPAPGGVRLGLPPGRTSKRERRERFQELLGPFGLDDRLRQPVRLLSGGERQLLALLIAQLRPSPVILLDEPLGALDPANTGRCLEAIEQLNRAGKTLLQVTHDEDLALDRGHRTIALREGRIVYDASGGERRLEELASCWYHPRVRA